MDNICSICYCENTSENEQYKPTCNHKFHKECIKAWYQSGHPSCRFCPICRLILNGNEIDPFDVSKYKLVYKEFIKLDGVFVNNNYILIKMNSPNWKSLLKNLLILVTISQHQATSGNVNNRELFIKDINKNMTFGFFLQNVRFDIQRYNFPDQHTDQQIKPKLVLSEIDEFQFYNLVYLDRILLDITNNTSGEHSFIKSIYNNYNNNLITSCDAEVIASAHQNIHSYNIKDKSVCNYDDYSSGLCSVVLIPEVVTVHNITWYKLKCVNFLLIHGYK
jgi:hypothetical protein